MVAEDLTEVENRLGGNVEDLSFDEAKVWTFLAFLGPTFIGHSYLLHSRS